jgi:hypothetical protein
MEFNTEFWQFSSLGTSIYRLQIQMSVWLEKPRCCPDGRHKAFGWTTVRSAFQILQKFFPELSHIRRVLPYRPDGCTLAARNFHIKASRVRTIEHVVRTVTALFPYLCFGKKSQSWLNTEWRLDVLMKHPDECKLELKIEIGF